MERILGCTGCAWNSSNSRTAFSIKYFSWEHSRFWVHADGWLQIVVWEGSENVNIRQFGGDLWPWAHGTTHTDEEPFGWDECLTCGLRVWNHHGSEWRTRCSDLPTLVAVLYVYSLYGWLRLRFFSTFLCSHCNSFSLSSRESVCCNKQFPA